MLRANSAKMFGIGSRSALVTGAGGRIGASTALALHEDGYNVAIHYRSSDVAAKALVSSLNLSRPNSAVSLQAELGSSNALAQVADKLVEDAVAAFGSLHVLVNNASSFAKTPLLLRDSSSPPPEFDEAVYVSNALAPFLLTRSFARYVQRANKEAASIPDRSVILFGDALVRTSPHKEYSLYCMAKLGAESLAQSASAELAPEGIRVNCVRPGFNSFPIAMPEDEQRRLRALVPLRGGVEGAPTDISNAIRFLVDPVKAGYISGAMIDIDGGLRHIAKS